MIDFIGIGLIFTLWGIASCIRFKPQVTRTAHLIVISYLVRDRFGETSHRAFIVFNTQTLRFIK